MRPNAVENGKNLAQISAALAAAVTGHDPSIAAHTALNAVTENSFAYTIPAAAVGYVAFKSSDYDTPGEALEALGNTLDEKLQGVLGEENYKVVSQKIRGYLDQQISTLSPGQGVGHIASDLTEILDGAFQTIDTYGAEGAKTAADFHPMFKDFGFAVGAMAGTVAAGLGKVKGGKGKAAATAATKETAKKAAPKAVAKPAKAWKKKIHGKAQVTGGKKNPDAGHAFISKKEAIRAAKKAEVDYVQMDLGVNRMLPKGAKLGPKGNTRPDVAYKTKDGKINQVEVPSKTDREWKLNARMKNTKSKFPEKMQGETETIKREFK